MGLILSALLLRLFLQCILYPFFIPYLHSPKLPFIQKKELAVYSTVMESQRIITISTSFSILTITQRCLASSISGTWGNWSHRKEFSDLASHEVSYSKQQSRFFYLQTWVHPPKYSVSPRLAFIGKLLIYN